jgi:signal transduction histidine kinase
VFSDKYLINKILVNLLSNALKFSGKNVELNIIIIKNNLNITVRDYGIGIPDSQINEIFNPFVKGKNASKYPGTGIGLSIVARAVELLRGTVSVHSEPEKETEFQVIIPCHQSRRTTNKPKNKSTITRNKTQLHYD